jgi:hypothetical protein
MSLMIKTNSPLGAQAVNGSFDEDYSGFIPDPALFSANGDLTIAFLSGNGVLFDGRSDDPWYQATLPRYNVSMTNQVGTTPGYVPQQAASPLGCLQQWQWCNTAYPDETGCGPLAGVNDAFTSAAALFNVSSADMNIERPVSDTETGSLLIWPGMLLFSSNFGTLSPILRELGPKSLASQLSLYGGIQYSLQETQWQLDVLIWWNSILASVQYVFVDVAQGPTGMDVQEFELVAPLNNEEKKLCNNQVRSVYCKLFFPSISY